MTAAWIRIGGLSVPISSTPARTSAEPMPSGLTEVVATGRARPLRLVQPQDRVCPWGAPPPCGVLAEPGEGNPDGYCSQHLDALAGEQEDWESDEEFARRRRMLCPYQLGQLGAGLAGIEWCHEPSDPGSDDGWCLVHNPYCDPSDPQYDPDAARHHLDELVPCLQCRGYPGCEMCGGTGRISLRKANWHRGDDDCADAAGEGSGVASQARLVAITTAEAPQVRETITGAGRARALWGSFTSWLAGSTLTRRDRGVWAAATTLEHLCGLTGLWLNGEIDSQPGYYGPVDVDEDDVPGITAALISLSQAGFLTRSSQAGFAPAGGGGDWLQVAAVTGYASAAVIEHLRKALQGSGYQVTLQPEGGIVVTWRDGQPYTTFGRPMTGADVDWDLQGCSPTARAAVRAAQQVVIWDPIPGRNTLWEHVRHTLDDGGIG